MSVLHTILHYSWCLPQTLLGLIIRGCGHEEIVKCDKSWHSGYLVGVAWLKDSMFSLGRHVFYPTDGVITLTDKTIRHEFGHSKQSLILGPLYLPVIALPSLIWHWWYYAGKKKKMSYYAFFTEKWANKLAGIDLV